jgi:hypothetical protein
MRTILINIILLFSYSVSFAQNTDTSIQGWVYDSKSGEPIPFIGILFNNSKAQTDLNGNFKIAIDKSFIEKQKQYLYVEPTNGYEKDSVLMDKSVDFKKIKIYLKKSGVELKANPPIGEIIKLIEK